MILDSSALVAIALDEPERPDLLAKMDTSDVIAVGAPTLVEDPSLGEVVWAGGYGGHGLAQAFVLGRAAADWASRRREGRTRTA